VRPPATRPFTDGDLDAAATLLAERHRRHRLREPALDPRFEQAAEARAALEALWRTDGASGAVGEHDGEVVSYVLGIPLDESTWGANVWVESAGFAAASAEDIRDTYATAAERWVDEGRRRHYVLVPAGDDAVIDAWFRLSFGHQQSHGIQEPVDREPTVPEGYSIRPPTLDDVDRLTGLDIALPQHQRLSPVFSELSLPTLEESRAEWEETLAGSDEHILIGFKGDDPVACWSMVDWSKSRHADGVMAAGDAAYLAFAVTLPEARGSGIGRALTDAAMAWAAREGYRVVVTDWRETNLLASRFWPARGFRPYFVRLYRSIP
jgi:ribosomal protein S18 acetylase RimI-like enzyme